ncbi:indolepyruvate ferredoxin oxidoreductase family protein [Streptomyces sp. BH106]|uniref:indolepyruvate ferredoxin oxidoreductase family protein n=1 Tax=Streptomyces sp. BH106 TaxID=3410409 RepID=UPI003CF1530B
MAATHPAAGPGTDSAARFASRYEGYGEEVHLTGIQALVRAVVERRRSDQRAGLDTAGFVSGYPGSPLGGIDMEIEKQAGTLGPLGIVHQPGVNEELAATAVLGSQYVEGREQATVTGVTGWWYGKAPGLDRAADAIRHGNHAGTGPHSGAVMLVGDDPSSKSSTLPSASEWALHDLMLPILFPGTVGEVLPFAHHAVELSRACGLWTAMKIVTDVADGSETVVVEPGGPPRLPAKTYTHRSGGPLMPPMTLTAEQNIQTERLEIARQYGRLNQLNRITLRAEHDWLGVVAPGKTYFTLLHGLARLGVSEADLSRAGVRLLKVGMPWPLDGAQIREFAQGLDEVLVLEEKRAFLELLIARELTALPAPPRLVGKTDEEGRVLAPSHGTLTAPTVASLLLRRAGRKSDLKPAPEPSKDGSLVGRPLQLTALPARTPYFCSGCPHNRSAQVPDGTLVGAGIGCHLMVAGMDERFGEITSSTQMGGEGAQWTGMAPFLQPAAPFVQNIGDGTFFHSGHLALRQAITSGATLTYKILYNTAVAMTGGQTPSGSADVANLTRLLEAEGVVRTIVTTDAPGRYKRVRLARNATVYGREKLLEAQEELTTVPGVTVLIHDQICTAQKRRLRKRDKAKQPEALVHINERVCEGCGDCARQSNCVSLQPVETEFGPKTRIHQSSCNQDYSCVDGNCPSFVSVTGGGSRPAPATPPEPPALPAEPAPDRIAAGEVFTVRMAGIGGTGVVTVNQVLAAAALADGLKSAALDQTGTAQKGGPVVSDLLLGTDVPAGNRADSSGCDLLLGFDPVVALAEPTRAAVANDRTRVVMNTDVSPTGAMVNEPREAPDSVRRIHAAIDAAYAPDLLVTVPAGAIAEDLLNNSVLSNVVVLGAAYQAGWLPIPAERIRAAFELNGVAVRANHEAFAWGRAWVAEPDAVRRALGTRSGQNRSVSPEVARLVRDLSLPDDLADRTRRWADELTRYQNVSLAREFLVDLDTVWRAERSAAPGSTRLTAAVGTHLYKLLAYKDEYEVARLHLDFRDTFRRSGGGGTLQFHLMPPVFKALGRTRKIRLGERTASAAFTTLRAARRLRGTPLDPFGLDRIRRAERQLIAEYRAVVPVLLDRLAPESLDAAVAIAELPDLVRGYDEVKLANVAEYRQRLEGALDEFRSTYSRKDAPA